MPRASTPQARDPADPVVAYGARMSWAGIMRPGDEFPLPVRSQLASMMSESAEPLRRYFGGWSAKYRRFTSNLSTPMIRVIALTGTRSAGIPCVLHWVRRSDLSGTGPGSVCGADGWPTALWEAFASSTGKLRGDTVGERLRAFLRSDLEASRPVVSAWRRCLSGKAEPRDAEALGGSWLPVPVTLLGAEGSGACVVSWAVGTKRYASLSEAVASREARLGGLDHASQARYYAECMLAGLHGVAFDTPGDSLKDGGYARREEVRKVLRQLARLERERIADRHLGSLDRFVSRG